MKVNFETNEQLEENVLLLQANQMKNEIKQIIFDIENRELSLGGSINGKIVSQPVNNFIRVFTSQKKVYGVTIKEELTLDYRLYELENLLPENFIRISNTEIVNLNYISRLELTKNGIISIYLKNEEQTSSSRRYLSKIKEKLL